MSVNNNVNDNLCIICESPNANSHFGAISCRACGAFFRRLVVSNRRYDCKCEENLRGKVESEMARKRRILNCRGCRLKKCIAAGMKEEAVKSVIFRDFHNERKRILKSHEISELDLINQLLDIEEKASRIYLNAIGFSSDSLKCYSTFADLLKCNENLLAYSENYQIRQNFHFDMEIFEEHLQKDGLWSKEPIGFIKHLLIPINIAKLFPTYSRLEFEDQVVSVNSFVLTAAHLIGLYHSTKRNVQTAIIELNDYPMIKLYTKWTNSPDQIVKSLAKAIFDTPMENFIRVFPVREEFILLLALLYTSAALSNPALSKNGQRIMNEESEKCAKTLLRLQQRQFGEQGGALRYAECLQLLWNAINTTKKHQELIVYIDTFYEQGRFEAVIPKILAPLVIGRKEKCD